MLMKNVRTLPGFLAVALAFSAAALTAPEARALDLDWSGAFRSEYNFLHNYTLDSATNARDANAARAASGGYYVPTAGSNDANFQSLFLKLQPKVIVNDNVSVKSEWWVGDPAFSAFGDAAPYNSDSRYYDSTRSRGSFVTMQRLWADLTTDFGVVQVGRAPLQWGLGVVWNAGDGLWDHFESTGDTLRLISKFGNFAFMPSFVYYSAGNTFGGTCDVTGGVGATTCTQGQGSGTVAEYTLGLKYENPDEEFEGGVNLVHRISGAGQDASAGYTGPSGAVVGFNYNTWDLYLKKRMKTFAFAVEAPIVTGKIGGVGYSTFALASELKFQPSDAWEFRSKLGHAPGQPVFAGTTMDRYKAFYFHPNYKLGMILFNYNLYGLAGPNTANDPNLSPTAAKSPWDASVVNANYVTLGSMFHTDKWTFHLDWIYARAANAAKSGQSFYNPFKKTIGTGATKDQGNSLGWEVDLGTSFQWDDHFQFGFDTGLFKPGDFFAFSNVAGQDNATAPLIAVEAKVGVKF